MTSPADQKAQLDALLNQPPTDDEQQKAKLDGILAKEPPPDMGESWYEDPTMAARAFLQGTSLGWSDEIGAAAAAGMARLTGEAKDYGEAYNDILGTLQTQRQEWGGEHPGASLGLNLAGGFATGGTGVSRLLATNAVKTAGTIGKVAASTGVGVTEGAIAGAGSSNPGSRGGGALTGAAIGAVLPLGVAGARPAVNAASAGFKQIPHTLGKGLDFKPLNLVDDGFLGDFYRGVIGKGLGGRTAMRDQSNRVVGGLRRASEFAAERLESANEQVRSVLRTSKNAAKHKSSAANTKAALSVGEAKDVAEATFRRATIIEAAPLGLGDEARGIISGKPAHEAVEKLDEFWGDHGFKVIKDRQFDVDEDELFDELSKVLGDDAALDSVMREFLGPLRTVFRKGFTRGEAIPNPKRGDPPAQWLFDAPPNSNPNPKGKIEGGAFLEMRNFLARMANQAAPDGQGALLGHAAGKITEKLDDAIKKQLNSTELAQYTDELSRWTTMKILRDATVSAGRERGGQFVPSDWLGASQRNAKTLYRRGKAPVQAAAMKTQKELLQADEHLQKTALTAKKTRDMAIKKAERQARLKPEAREAEATASKAKEHYLAGKELSPGETPSLFEQLFNTGLLGFGFGMSNLATGGAMGRTLATEGVQRAMVGQSGVQSAMRKGLDNYDKIAPVARQAGRAINRQVTRDD